MKALVRSREDAIAILFWDLVVEIHRRGLRGRRAWRVFCRAMRLLVRGVR